MEEMANKRRLEKKRILEKNKDRLVVYHSAKNNTESIVSESSRGDARRNGVFFAISKISVWRQQKL